MDIIIKRENNIICKCSSAKYTTNVNEMFTVTFFINTKHLIYVNLGRTKNLYLASISELNIHVIN